MALVILTEYVRLLEYRYRTSPKNSNRIYVSQNYNFHLCHGYHSVYIIALLSILEFFFF